jgi:hypothetical protein
MYLGSSETTREASFFDLNNYQPLGNSKFIDQSEISSMILNQNSKNFLTWFIGFSEGDGSFFFTEKRLFFVINQKKPKVLYKIRKELGFGSIREYIQNEKTYYRFEISSKQNVLRLISLFNGNIVLDKVYDKFQKWVNKANQLWEVGIFVKQKQPKITLNDGWLSGFIEADGGFYARVRKNSKMVVGYQLQMKFYITQQNELETLNKIKDLLESNTNIRQIYQKSRIYNRLEIMSFLSHSILINYLERYPCKGEKNVLILRWKKIYWRREKQEHLTEIGIKKLRQLSKKVIEIQKKIEDIVQSEQKN